MVTLYALFMDDIRILTCPIGADEILWGVTSGAFGLFIFELLLSSLAIDDYLCGFYFWLDLIATISLISDIGWIWNKIFPQQSIADFEAGSGSGTQISSNNVKGAKTGARIGWVIRVIRLVWLIWVVKLYKHASNAMVKKDPIIDQVDVDQEEKMA